MKFSYKIFFVFFIYPIIPLFLFFVGVGGSLLFTAEEHIPFFGFAGLLAGIIIDVFFIRKFIYKGFKMNRLFQVSIYLFYSFCIFGFFMGFPAFNIFLGIIAGIYTAGKAVRSNKGYEESIKQIKKVSFFTSAVIFFICIVSISMAFVEQNTINYIKELLEVSFSVTKEMIYALILAGGIALVFAQYHITRITGLYFLKHKENMTDISVL